VPPNDVTPESEARWQLWLASGRARDARTRHRTRVSLLALLFGAIVVAAFALGLR
jgi:hypothetical protein